MNLHNRLINAANDWPRWL